MTYLEKDNHGTGQFTVEQADAYWFNRNFGTGKSEPFLLYAFRQEDEARKALTEVDFIHPAADTGNLISSRVCHFGYYRSQAGHWEAIMAGSEFSLEEFKTIKKNFINNNGFVINERAPEKDAFNPSKETTGTAADSSKIVFKEKYNKPVPPGMGNGYFTYEKYEAPDKATALKFLEEKDVTLPNYYLLVDTPQGSFGKDKVGIYDA